MDAAAVGDVIFRFGDFELDPRSGELRRGAERIALARKPSALLLLLVQQRDRLVPRAEILRAVWPGVRVSNAAFASALRDLRRTLGDQGAEPRYVESIRAQGVRFVAPLEIVPARAARVPSSFVGRSALIGSLVAAFHAARGGSGRVVLLGGEAGIGKTRTANEAAARARSLGATVYVAQCGGGAFAPPHHVWVQILDAMARDRDVAEIGNLLGARRRDVARLVPALGGSAHAPDEDALYALYLGVVAWLRDAARAAPLVLVVDDLHACDRASLRLLEYVASEIGSMRVLILATHRIAELESGHPLYAALAALERLPGVERHLLVGLDVDEAVAFAATHAGRALPRELVEALHERSDGNPFFLRQLVAAAAARGDAELQQDVHVVPASAREWVRGQLAALSPRAVDCLCAGAVLGRDFRAATLAQVAALDETACFEALEEARRAGLVGEERAGERRFVHALIQEAIYDDSALPQRVELHRRAGEALLALASADRGELLSSVAHHFAVAVSRVGSRAVDAAERAAEHAEKRLAFAEAAHLRERALTALDRVAPEDRNRRCDLLLGLARALLGAREFDRACDVARRTAALAREIGRADALAEAGIVLSDYLLVDASEPREILEEALAGLSEATSLRVQALCALSNHLWYTGRPELRRALADDALAAARSIGDPSIVAVALLAKRNAHHAPDQIVLRLRLDAEAVRESGVAGSDSQRCLALSWRAVDLLESGDLTAAQRDVDVIARTVAEGRARRFLPFESRWRGMRALMGARFDAAQRWAAEATARMRLIRDPYLESYGGVPLALALQEQGRLDEVGHLAANTASWFVTSLERIPVLRAGAALIELELGRPGSARRLLDELSADGWARLDCDPEQLGTLSFVAEIVVRLARADLAAQLHDRTRAWSGRIANLYAIACRGSMARYVGLLARAAGRIDAAVECLDEAIDANRAIGADLYLAWSLWECAQALRERRAEGDARRAETLAREAQRLASERGMKRLLRTIQTRPRPSRSLPNERHL